MRLSKSVVFFLPLVCFLFGGICKVQSQSAVAKTPSTHSLKSVSIILQRANTSSMKSEDEWFPALLEAALEFKFAAIKDLVMIDPLVVSKEVPGHNDLRQLPDDADYIRAAKRLGVDYVVNQKCTVSKSKAVDYYAEIRVVSDGSQYKTVDKSFKLEDFGSAIDDLVGLYLLELGIAQPKELARFLKLPAVSTNVKMITTLGELITKERYMTGVDATQLANDYRVLCEKDRSYLLAYYRAGLFFEEAGKLADASEALNILFMTIPEYTPVYVPLARIFRKNNRFDDAVRIANLGQKRGVTSSELSTELALANAAREKKNEPIAVSKPSIANRSNDPVTLSSNKRQLNDEGKVEEASKLSDQKLSNRSVANEKAEQNKANLETNKGDYNNLVQQGTRSFSLKKYDAAIEALEKAVAIKNTDIDILMKLGSSYFETKKYKQAIDILSRARNSNRDNPEILLLLAECFRASAATKNLIEILGELADLDRKSFDVRVELANLLIKENRTSEAITILEDAVLLRKCQTEIHLQLARLYEQTKSDELWLKHINAATVCSPRNAQLYMELGMYHFNKKDYVKADSYLRKALTVDSKLHEGSYLLGIVLRDKKNYTEAKVYFQKAIEIKPDSSKYRVAYAEILFQEGKAANALKIIESVVSQPNLTPSALRVAGLIYNTTGKVDVARQMLNKAIASDPSCAECFAALGDVQYGNTEFSDAAKSYQKAIGLGSSDDGVNSRLANCFIKINKFDQALNLLEKTIKSNPRNGEAIYRICHIYILNSQQEKVRTLMNASSTPKNGWYYLTQGELNEIEGKIDAAMISYTTALKTLPNVSEVQAGCGRINLLKKRFTSAIEYLGQAIAGDPENVQLYMDLGKAYEGSGDLSTAMELYKEVESRMADHPEVHYYMARIFSKNNDHNAAIDILFKGIDRNRKSIILYMTLGQEYQLIKDSNKAIDIYLRATQIDETRASDGYKYIGNIYYEMNDEKKAKKYYEMYINAGGQDPKIKTLVQRM